MFWHSFQCGCCSIIVLNESSIIFQVHCQHDSLLKAFSQPISLACCQLSTDCENTFHVRMPQMQELTAGPGQVEATVGIY